MGGRQAVQELSQEESQWPRRPSGIREVRRGRSVKLRELGRRRVLARKGGHIIAVDGCAPAVPKIAQVFAREGKWGVLLHSCLRADWSSPTPTPSVEKS